MTKHTPYSPGETIKSSNTNDDIDGLSSGENDIDNNKLGLFRLESFDPYFVADGAVWSLTSGLVGVMSSGVMYINGNRIPLAAIGSKTFAASSDTYVDFNASGVVSYNAVSNNGTPPTLPPGSIRNAIIVTDGTTITKIIQRDRDKAANLVYNTKPIAQASSFPRVNLITSVSTLTPDVTSDQVIQITALASNLTIAMPSGTPENMQPLWLRIRDNGTARTLSWNSVYRPYGVTIPTATVASKGMNIVLRYDAIDSKWDVLSVGRET